MGQERENIDGGKRSERSVRLDSLDDAFARYGIPVGNRALIQGIHDNAGASRLIGFSDYFRIERRGGGPALEVHRSYTNGFRSEQDAKKSAGDAPRWPSRRLHGSWGVDHPEIGRVEEPPARSARLLFGDQPCRSGRPLCARTASSRSPRRVCAPPAVSEDPPQYSAMTIFF